MEELKAPQKQAEQGLPEAFKACQKEANDKRRRRALFLVTLSASLRDLLYRVVVVISDQLVLGIAIVWFSFQWRVNGLRA